MVIIVLAIALLLSACGDNEYNSTTNEIVGKDGAPIFFGMVTPCSLCLFTLVCSAPSQFFLKNASRRLTKIFMLFSNEIGRALR